MYQWIPPNDQYDLKLHHLEELSTQGNKTETKKKENKSESKRVNSVTDSISFYGKKEDFVYGMVAEAALEGQSTYKGKFQAQGTM